jgi:cytochrome c2
MLSACGSLSGEALTNPQEKPEVLAAFKAEPLDIKGDATQGGIIFSTQNCLSCHSLQGAGGVVGPPLDNVGGAAATREQGVTATQYLHHILLHPGDLHLPGYRPIMPGVANALSDQQVNDLVIYLLSFKDNR